MKSTIKELFMSSAIIQGSLALISIGIIAYLYIAGKPVPSELIGLMMTIVGYYFGSKTQQASNRKDQYPDVTKY